MLYNTTLFIGTRLGKASGLTGIRACDYVERVPTSPRRPRHDASDTPEVLQNLGRKIAAARYDQGLTLDDLADRTGVSRKTITHVELGYSEAVRFMTVYLLAEALEVSMDDLVK